MASRPGHTAASDHHFDPVAIAARSCDQTLKCKIFSWCYQRPQPIPVVHHVQEKEPHGEYRPRRLSPMLQQTARDLEYLPDAVADDSMDRQTHRGAHQGDLSTRQA